MLKERINRILHALHQDLYEREEVIQLSVLATLAGESVFLLGPPGVAKSLIARRLKTMFAEGEAFEYLMNRFSTPDEIFGPISISKLKNEDAYERLTQHYLPQADVVFLDEIWKAGPSIQNTLLTVLNEKIYRNGHTLEKLPLKGLIAASNELPAENEGLEALWDRFLIRYLVDGIRDDASFLQFISGAEVPFVGVDQKDQISPEEFQEWHAELGKVTLPDEVLNVIQVVRKTIARQAEKKKGKLPGYISDRRWKKVVGLLKSSAFFNDRQQVDLMDCFLMAHCLWDTPDQIEPLREEVAKAIKSHGYRRKYDLQVFEEAIAELKREVTEETRHVKVVAKVVAKEYQLEGSKDGYYKLLDEDHNLLREYVYLKKSDFEQITPRAFRKVELVNEHLDGPNNNTVKGKRLDDNDSLLLYTERGYYALINFNETQFHLETETKQERQTETRRPHKAILSTWNQHIAELHAQAEATINEIKGYQRETLGHLRTNPFVPPALAKYPEDHLNQLIKQLHQYEMQLTEIKEGYEALR